MALLTSEEPESAEDLEYRQAFERWLLIIPKPSQNLFRDDQNPIKDIFFKNQDLLSAILVSSRQHIKDRSALIQGNRKQPFIFVGFSEDSTFNACADVFEGKHIICFNAGTPLIIYSVFCRLLSNPNVLRNVGDPSREIEDGPHAWSMPYQITDYEEIVQARFNAGADDPEIMTLPRCPIRRSFAFRLFINAFNFLLFHEYCHLKSGHVQLNKQLTGQSFLEDNPEIGSMEWSAEDGSIPMVRQALEYDADSYGANWSLRLDMHFTQRVLDHREEAQRLRSSLPAPFNSIGMLISIDREDSEETRAAKMAQYVAHTMESKSFGDLQLTVSTTEDSFHAWAFAVASLFKLTGLGKVNVNSLDKRRYPPPAIRLSIAACTGDALIEQSKPSLRKEFIQMTHAGFREANEAFTHVCDAPSDILTHYLPISQNAAVRNHYSKLEAQWFELLDDLRPYAWGKLTNDTTNATVNDTTNDTTRKSHPRRKELTRGQRRCRRQ